MDSLRDAIEAVERRRKTLEVYTDDESVAAELAAQFSTRNVAVTHRSLPPTRDAGFVIVRDADERFQGALGLDHFDAVLSPEIHPPWALAESETNHAELFDFLDNTVFTSYDRRQMLAAAREIEERAWRVGDGVLRTGFQRGAALAAQAPVYERLAGRGTLTIELFVADEWDVSLPEAVSVVTDEAPEVGQFWFLVFDGAGSDLNKCALLAEERTPDEYYGFWTYDPALVDDLATYLEDTYG